MLRGFLVLLAILMGTAGQAETTRDDLIELARAGWSYELRTTMRRPGSAGDLPDLHARRMVGAHLCLLGEAPSPRTQATLTAFRTLLTRIFGNAPQISRAGQATDCPAATMFLRLYSTRDPTQALNADIRTLNARFDIGLSRSTQLPTSPGQAQTFFGRRGMVTHLLVMQDGPDGVPAAHTAFYRSLLIEELYQSLTFGMDVLHLDTATPLLSKLEEVPVRAAFLPWRSEEFIAEMARGGTRGLCGFDVLMLVALAESDLTRSNGPAFIAEVSARFARYRARALTVMDDPTLTALFDPACHALPD